MNIAELSANESQKCGWIADFGSLTNITAMIEVFECWQANPDSRIGFQNC
jgi:hypothetical protein